MGITRRSAALVRRIAMGVALIASASSSLADPPSPPARHAPEVRLPRGRVIFPIEMVREFPFVSAEIAGVHGKLMLDTGARQALVVNDHRVALPAGAAAGTGHYGSGQSFAVKVQPSIADVRIGHLRFPRVTSVETQDAAMLEGITPDFLGWLGFDAWSGHALKLDYRRRAAIFDDGGPARYLKGETVVAILPFAARRLPNHPIMTVRIGDVDAVAALDTGQYGGLYTSPEVRAHLLRTGHLKPGRAGDDVFDLGGIILGGTPVADIPGLDVSTAPFAAAEPLGLKETTILSIGYGLLRRYKTVWDFRRGRIYLLKP